MSDIFNKDIYPHKGKIKDHFKDYYDSVFVAFLPFFQVDRQPSDEANLKKAKHIAYEEAKQEMEFLKDIPKLDTEIFSYSNNEYPTDKEIYENDKAVVWSEIIKGAGLNDFSELNKALRTSIGALRQVFQRPELTEKLNNYTDRQNIWHPTEGSFDTLSKVAIYKTLKLLEKNQIIVTDEFYETTSIIDLDKLSDFEFTEKVGLKDYYVYSEDKQILFTIEWDSFFFLVATDSKRMKQIVEANLFEGLLCNESTEHTWDYEEGEIQKYLDIEEKQKVLTVKPMTKKQW